MMISLKIFMTMLCWIILWFKTMVFPCVQIKISFSYSVIIAKWKIII